MKTSEISDTLYKLGQLYQLKKDRFRSRAFLDASKIVEDCPVTASVFDILSLDGIGEFAFHVIKELYSTGSCFELQELEIEFPDAALDLTWISGISSIGAQKIAKQYQVKSMEELLEKLECSKADLDLYQKVLVGIEKKTSKRIPREKLNDLVRYIIDRINTCSHVKNTEIVGSWRRERLTLKDLDILIGIDNPKALSQIRLEVDKLGRIDSIGESKIRIYHSCNDFSINIDFQIVDIDNFGAALLYFTGSKSYNNHIRSIAKAIGLKLNEYGLYRDGLRIAGKSEEEIFKILHIPYVEPRNRRT